MAIEEDFYDPQETQVPEQGAESSEPVPATPVAAESESPTPAAPAPAPPEKPERLVPLESLLEERRKFQSKLDEQDQQLKTVADELSKLKPKPEAPVAPDFLEDPKGYIDSAVERIEKSAKHAGTTAEQLRAQTDQEAQFRGFVSNIQTDEAAFAARQPDYQDALRYLREQRAADLKMVFPQATDQQVIQQLSQEELALSAQVMQSGRSPAEVAYEYAKRRGYAGKAAPAGKPSATAAEIAAATQTLGAAGGTPEGDPDFDADNPMAELDAAISGAFRKKA